MCRQPHLSYGAGRADEDEGGDEPLRIEDETTWLPIQPFREGEMKGKKRKEKERKGKKRKEEKGR